MNISLYYIEGISNIDTPLFESIDEQKNYMNNHLINSVDSSFYPPHYRNLIKFSSEDVILKSSINYLSLEYQDKEYYYFIDDITYISEGIIQLSVTMDVIQTYMFNINIKSGIIERKFINRWVDNKINRDYMRENVSSGLFQLSKFSKNSIDYTKCSLVCKFADNEDPYCVMQGFGNVNDDRRNYIPGYIWVLPLLKTKVGTYFDSISDKFKMINGESKLISAYFVPNICFKGYNVVKNSDSYNVEFDGDYWDEREPHSSDHPHTYVYIPNLAEPIFGTDVSILYTQVQTDTVEFKISRNNQIDVPFSSKYITQMLDENYIRLLFGSYVNNTTFPLFMLDNNKCYTHWYMDILNGSRMYLINETASSINDKYRTIVSDIEPIKIDIINDSYAEYQATNKYRWLQAIGQVAITGSRLYLDVKTKGAFAIADIASVYASSRTPVKGQLSKKGSREISAIQRRQDLTELSAKEVGINSSSVLLSQGAEELNKLYYPDNVKQTGYTSDFINNAFTIFTSIEIVNDYEQCAQYYHRNGYLVNEYINEKDNIFQYVNNRHYFNIIKGTNFEVHLKDAIEDEDTCDNIKERFSIGIRLWNVKFNNVKIGDFTYDNLENE